MEGLFLSCITSFLIRYKIPNPMMISITTVIITTSRILVLGFTYTPSFQSEPVGVMISRLLGMMGVQVLICFPPYPTVKS